jgi:signal peptidase
MTSHVAVTGFARASRRAVEVGLVALALTMLLAVLAVRVIPATGRTVLVVGGSSMEPAVHRGSAVLIEPVSAGNLATGDLVSVRVGPGQAIFTHRITRLVSRPDGVWIETRGDANAEPDPALVPASAVVGRVAGSVPGLGYLIASLSQPVGVGAAVGLTGVLLAVILLLEEVERPSAPTRRRPVIGGPDLSRGDTVGAAAGRV